MRNSRRTVFVSLDDGTGLSNIVFFPDAQARVKNRVFRTTYMLVRGRTRRQGARGTSVTGAMAWDLTHLPAEPIAARTRPDAAEAHPVPQPEMGESTESGQARVAG